MPRHWRRTSYKQMKIVYGVKNLPQLPEKTVVTVGVFDGVHRGHQAVFARAREIADRTGAPLVAVTFEPHPRSFFRPDDEPFRNLIEPLEPLNCFNPFNPFNYFRIINYGMRANRLAQR